MNIYEDVDQGIDTTHASSISLSVLITNCSF
jgi:hypothetical protein